MTVYDPHARPFWEQKSGSGPIGERMAAHERADLIEELKDIDDLIFTFEADLQGETTKWGAESLTKRLAPLLALRDEIQRQLGRFA